MEMEMVTRIQGVPACGSHDIRPRGWSHYSKRGRTKRRRGRRGRGATRTNSCRAKLTALGHCLFVFTTL